VLDTFAWKHKRLINVYTDNPFPPCYWWTSTKKL